MMNFGVLMVVAIFQVAVQRPTPHYMDKCERNFSEKIEIF
jgi:hypothetical protein